MLSGKIPKELLEFLSNCGSTEEIYENLKDSQPNCEMKDAEDLYNTFLHKKGNGEDLNGMCTKLCGGLWTDDNEPFFKRTCHMNFNVLEPVECPMDINSQNIPDFSKICMAYGSGEPEKSDKESGKD